MHFILQMETAMQMYKDSVLKVACGTGVVTAQISRQLRLSSPVWDEAQIVCPLTRSLNTVHCIAFART